ncbi:MAG: hypothetical protein DWP97_08835 [Calditrichaeota bacterium]|nr:MAG: hypothetical protein DWP97_08835 [Calditrichota bacterium]
MKNQIRLTVLALAAFMFVAAFIGCSDDPKIESNSLADKAFDSAVESVSNNLAEAVVDQPEEVIDVEPVSSEVDIEPADITPVYEDFVLFNDKIYAVNGNKLIVYDRKSEIEKDFMVDDLLHTVAVHQSEIFVGGETLYKLNDTTLEYVDDQFDGVITTLYSTPTELYIGTENGLYSKSVFGKEKILDDFTISSLVADNGGLWIGTQGEGLFRWDGEKFKKRFLTRDTTIFDYVNSLDFNHNHLYVGCDNGFYIFDGGKWETLTTEDGLPDNNIRTIDASGWVVYVGSDKGVISYFNDEIKPVNKLEDRQVNHIEVQNRKIFASTSVDGIVEKSGNVVKTVISPTQMANTELLSLLP